MVQSYLGIECDINKKKKNNHNNTISTTTTTKGKGTTGKDQERLCAQILQCPSENNREVIFGLKIVLYSQKNTSIQASRGNVLSVVLRKGV